MKSVNKTIAHSAQTFALVALLALSGSAFGTIIDNFDNAKNTSSGIPRVSVSDTTAGGNTTTEIDVTRGVIKVKGEIMPPRGQPGWSSLVLPLGPMGKVHDASQFAGVRLLIKINRGNMSISANSAEVTNYDYHAAPVVVSSDGKFHEVKIPFTSMKRIWSAQTKLNTQMLNSLSIVAFSPQKATYDFEVDEVSFY